MDKLSSNWKIGCVIIIFGLCALPILANFYYDYRGNQLHRFLDSLTPGMSMAEVDQRAREYGFNLRPIEVWDNKTKQNRESRHLLVRVGLDVDYIDFDFDESGKYTSYEGGDIDLELDFITYH